MLAYLLHRSLLSIMYGTVLFLCVAIFAILIYNGQSRLEYKTQMKANNGNASVLPPFFRYREEYLISKKYGLATCQIEKIMTTIKDGLFCFLLDTKSFIENNRTISGEHWHDRFCSDMQHFRNNLDNIYTELGGKVVLFAIIRDPLERLVSGYVDKCLRELHHRGSTCYQCFADIRCFLDELQISLQNVLQQKRGYFYYDRHFAPQSWYCDFKNHLKDYTIIRYVSGDAAKLASQIDNVLRRAGVPVDERQLIEEELLKGTTSHSTHGSKEAKLVTNMILTDRELIRKVTDLYFYDFLYFNFSFPVLLTQ